MAFADLDLAPAQRSADRNVDFATNPAYYRVSIQVDVTDLASVEQMVSQAVETFKRIDYLGSPSIVNELPITE